MKLIALLTGLALTTLTFSQDTHLKDLAEKYAGQEGYTYVYVTEYMFELAGTLIKEEAPQASELIKKLNNLLVITPSQEVNANRNERFADEVNSTIDKNSYKVLLKVKDGEEDVDILAKEVNGVIDELVITIKSPDEDVLVILDGQIDLKTVSKLTETSSFKIDGLEYLAQLDKQQNN